MESVSQRWMDSYIEKSSELIKDTNPLPNETDKGVEINHAFCDSMVKWVWEEVIPFRYSHKFRNALAAHRRRHMAVSTGNPEVDQKYIIWSLSGGLGNRVQALTSVLMSALLSERVLLLKDWFTPLRSSKSPPVRPILLPFAKNVNETEVFRYEDLRELFWFSNGESTPRAPNEFMFCSLFPMMSLSEFERIYPDEFRNHNYSHDIVPFKNGHAKIDIRAGHDKNLKLWKHFACGDPLIGRGIDFFSRQRFVYVWTNQYFLPIFYVNKRTSSVVKSWIKKDPFRSMLPLVFLPARPVMYRVLRRMRSSPRIQNRKYVGLHIRSFKQQDESRLIASFSICVRQFLDKVTFPNMFFLATMSQEAKNHFSILQSTSKSRFVVQETKGKNEKQSTGQGVVQEWEAVTDVVLLSLSRHIFLSPTSTFGFLAAAAGEIEAITVVSDRYVSGGLGDRTCMMLNGNVVTEPCFTSWFRLDSIGSRRHHIGCEMDFLPSWSLECGTRK
ncbi:hypothetical protein DQ04_02291110 [Trypanosoma grayi]|uniref:hypothetical protein n=1 Tax=Trypanosoma grayi TaxID=71804 RepID=UPI0004F3FE58|nr:hypothetical protein DQ04_02291110 [Trypanosoma grayi]KEG11781.1 hypothetical protein DQ04_02291110 [Trypanosoma grayi]